MTRRRVGTASLSIAACAVLLAGCGTDGASDPDGAAASEGATTSVEPSADPATGAATPTKGPEVSKIPAFPTNAKPQFEQSPGGPLIVFTGVRVAEHDGFDRIVLEFSGSGAPGWAVNYVDKPVLDGSGDVVTLAGDAYLDIYASNTTWPAPDYYDGPAQVQAPEGGEVEGLYVGGTFEGTTQILAGVDGDQRPFRVFALTAPSRLVVDVADSSAG